MLKSEARISKSETNPNVKKDSCLEYSNFKILKIVSCFVFRASYLFIGIFSFIIFLSGCSQPIRTLQGLASEQAGQQRFVNEKDAKFKVLYDDVKNNRLLPGGVKKRVIARYGEPVLEEGQTLIYRPVTNFFGKAKIYLTFDADGVLKQVRCEER